MSFNLTEIDPSGGVHNQFLLSQNRQWVYYNPDHDTIADMTVAGYANDSAPPFTFDGHQIADGDVLHVKDENGHYHTGAITDATSGNVTWTLA